MSLKALRPPPYVTCILALSAALATCVVPRSTHAETGPALPGEPCPTEAAPRPSWSETEKWVWNQICIGEIADLNEHFDPDGPPLDPHSPDGWTDERKLSSAFLETILLHDPWRSATTRQGVRIFGAWFDEPVNLVDAEITQMTWLDKSRFTENLSLEGLRTRFLLSFTGSVLTGSLLMNSSDVGLFMSEDAEFKDVSLRGAHIGRQLVLVRAKVTGTLNMDSANVGTDLILVDGQFSKRIKLSFAKIGGILGLRGATLADGLDLTETRIDSELLLGPPQPIWGDDAKLILRNTRVGALQDAPEAWPKQLDLNGFSYERFGGLGASPEAAVGQRGSKWFVSWLARDEFYTPQPYEQASNVLRQMGHPEMATDVLYAGRERDRKQAWQRKEYLRWLGLSLLNGTIGYGLGYRILFWPLYWVIALVLIGTIVLRATGQTLRDDGQTIGLWYSFDTLLPVVELRQAHYDIDLEGFARYWFYVHKLMGYVLVSFLIAGLSGLTS
jgi:hypothetical protein